MDHGWRQAAVVGAVIDGHGPGKGGARVLYASPNQLAFFTGPTHCPQGPAPPRDLQGNALRHPSHGVADYRHTGLGRGTAAKVADVDALVPARVQPPVGDDSAFVDRFLPAQVETVGSIPVDDRSPTLSIRESIRVMQSLILSSLLLIRRRALRSFSSR